MFRAFRVVYCMFVFSVVLTGNSYLKLVILYLFPAIIQQTGVVLTRGDFAVLKRAQCP